MGYRTNEHFQYQRNLKIIAIILKIALLLMILEKQADAVDVREVGESALFFSVFIAANIEKYRNLVL